MRGWQPLRPPICRRSALHPGDFLPDEKVTKESPRGGHPLWVLPLGGIIIPPAALPLPPEKGATPPRKGCHSGLSTETKSTCRATD